MVFINQLSPTIHGIYIYIVSIKYIQPVSCYLSAPTPPILCIPSNPWPVQLEASNIFKHVQPVLFFWELFFSVDWIKNRALVKKTIAPAEICWNWTIKSERMFPFLTSSTFDTGVSTKGNSMIPKSRRRSSCSFHIHDRTSAAFRNETRPPKLHGPMSICPKVWEFMGLYGYSSFLLVLFMISFYSVYLPFPGSFDHSRITDRTWMVVKYWPRCWYCISKTFRDGRCQWDGADHSIQFLTTGAKENWLLVTIIWTSW